VSKEVISADLRNFIARYIDSVAQLEALLLLHKDPTEKWTLEGVARRLYTGESETAAVLSRLSGDGMVTHQDQFYWYECAPALAPTVDRLSDAYRHQLIAITNLIHAKPRRIREFADAFKLKKDT
jgi:hypothetical protein